MNEDIAIRLDAMAAQENCDGEPYDTMVEAAKEIRRLRTIAHGLADGYYYALMSQGLESVLKDETACMEDIEKSRLAEHHEIDNPPVTQEHPADE